MTDTTTPTIDDAERIALVCAAANAVAAEDLAGALAPKESAPEKADEPEPFEARVAVKAVALAALAAPGSTVARAIEGVLGPDTKRFTGTVVEVTKEQSSTRGKVILDTGTQRDYDGIPAGCEVVRTERTDQPDGLAVARAVRSMVGRRVLVYVQVEPMANNPDRKVRVLRHVVDLGPAN